MFKNFAFSLGFLLFATISSAQATCMATCEDTDAGLDPRYAGVVIVRTSCSPPGGPVNTTTSQYFDRCENGIHSEYSCEGQAGMGMAVKREFKCLRCDPTRKGVCLSPQGRGVPKPLGEPAYSWSTTSGGGPHPEPTPLPSCAIPMCAAPPEGCNWAGATDANGCWTCGELVCVGGGA